MNVSKCKVMVSNNWNNSTDMKIGGSVVEVVEEFCYLGSFGWSGKTQNTLPSIEKHGMNVWPNVS